MPWQTGAPASQGGSEAVIIKPAGQSAKTKASQFLRLNVPVVVSSLLPPGINVKVNDKMTFLKSSQSFTCSFSRSGPAKVFCKGPDSKHVRRVVPPTVSVTDSCSFFRSLKNKKKSFSPHKPYKTGRRADFIHGPQFASPFRMPKFEFLATINSGQETLGFK